MSDEPEQSEEPAAPLIIEPKVAATVLLDSDVAIVWSCNAQSAAMVLGTKHITIFKNLVALVGLVRQLHDLATAWDSILPPEHPLRYGMIPQGGMATTEGGPGSEPPITEEQVSALSKLLEGVDLSGLDGGAPAAGS